MAITFTAGTAAESTSSTTTISVPLPTGFVSGDYILVVGALNASGGGFTTVPSGYTTIYALDTQGGSTSGHGAAYVKKWVSGDAAPTLTGASGRFGARAFKVSGADATTFLDGAYAVTHTATNTTAVAAPSVTPTAAGNTLVVIPTGRSGNTGTIITWTSPTGMTEVGEASGKDTVNTNTAFSLNTLDLTGTAATGAKTATASSTATGSFGVAFIVKAASTAPVLGENELVNTNFTGTNGTAWPAPWAGSTGNTIQSNRGQQATSATAWTDAAMQAGLNLGNGKIRATLNFPAVPGKSSRIDVRFNTSTGNGYRIIMPTDYAGFQMVKVVNWAETEIAADWSISWAANTDYIIDFEFVGSTLRAKRWIADTTEPSTWQLTTTDTTHTTGDVRLVTVTSAAAAGIATWDNVVVSTVAVSASAGADISVSAWSPVTLTATGTGTWTQTGGDAQTLQISGTSLTFTATPKMIDQTLVFEYGGDSVTVTVGRAQHGIVGTNGTVLPVRLRRN